MNELSEFSCRLSACDLIALLFVSTDLLYCRFFEEGLYKDRMFVSDPLLLAELSQVCGEDEVVDAIGIARLKQAFTAGLAAQLNKASTKPLVVHFQSLHI